MALVPIRPKDLPHAVAVYASDRIPTDDGVTVSGATPVQIADAGAPIASLPTALAGVNATDRITPLTLAQVLANYSGNNDALTVSVTFNVPSEYPTVQAAISAAKNIRVASGIEVIVNIEAGHQIATPISQAYADLRHVRITSVDATVPVAAGFAADVNVAQFIDCDCPIWDILLDCQGRGRNGVWLENSTMEVKPARGVQNAGAAGTLDPRGCGFFAWKGASLQVTPSTGPLTGMIARGCAWRGVDITHNSQASIVASDLTDNGTLIPIADGHAGLFVSRSSSVQADNSTFDGSVNGIRSARSMVTARTASFQNIPGVLVRQFEGGFVNVSGSNMANSGTATYPLLLIEGAAADRPQGGGQIIAESCDWTGAVYDLATVRGASGLIVLDDATGTGLLGRIGVAVNGKINADRATLAAAVGNTSNEALLASFGGNISAIGLTWTGAAGMSYTARAIEDGYISVAGANLTTATVAHLAVVDAGVIYSDGATVSAGVFPSVMKGPKAGQALRPEDFGAVAGGTVGGAMDDGAALVRFLAWPSGRLEFTPGAVYRLGARAALLTLAGSQIMGNGATILLDYTDTSANFQITMAALSKFTGLNILWSGSTYARRGLSIGAGAEFCDGSVAAETEQPTAAVSSSQDRTVILSGAGAKFNNNRVTNIWAVLRVNGSIPATDCEASNNKIYGYGKGFQPELGGDNFRAVGNEFFTKSSLTSQQPGEGAFAGSCNGLRLLYNTVWFAGEHAFYISEASSTVDVAVSFNIVYSSSQTGFKFRNIDGLTAIGNFQQDAAFGNATGPTEDAYAFESCSKIRGDGNIASIKTKTVVGQYAARFDSCKDVVWTNFTTDRPDEAAIWINAIRFEGALGGYAPEDITIRGTTVHSPGAKRLIDMLTVSSAISVDMSGTNFKGATGTVVTTNIGGTAGVIRVAGSISTTGSMFINTAGGGSVALEPNNGNLITPKNFGAVSTPSTVADDTNPIQRFYNYLAANGGTGEFSPGVTYGVTGIILIADGTKPFTVLGYGATVKRISNFTSSVIEIRRTNKVAHKGLTVDCQHQTYALGNHGIVYLDCNDALVEDVTVNNHRNTAILMYASVPSVKYGNVLRNCQAIGNVGSPANNGMLIADIDYSGLEDCYAEYCSGSPGYGVQLKNRCDWSWIKGARARNCVAAMAFGNDTGTLGVTNTFAEVVLSLTCTSAFVSSQSQHNTVKIGTVKTSSASSSKAIALATSVGNTVSMGSMEAVAAAQTLVEFDTGCTDNVVSADAIYRPLGTVAGSCGTFAAGVTNNRIEVSRIYGGAVGLTGALITDNSANVTNIFEYKAVPAYEEGVIATGVVSVRYSNSGTFVVDTEGAAAADTLDTITGPGVEGQVLRLRSKSNVRDVTVSHGTGNITLAGGVNFVLDAVADTLVLMWNVTAVKWVEVSRANNG